MIAFVTAYDAYAVEAFEVNAVDYLLKPVDPVRLRETIARAQDRLERADVREEQSAGVRAALQAYAGAAATPLQRIPVRKRSEIVLVPVESLSSIVADGELLRLTTGRGEKHTITYRLRDLESAARPVTLLPPEPRHPGERGHDPEGGHTSRRHVPRDHDERGGVAGQQAAVADTSGAAAEAVGRFTLRTAPNPPSLRDGTCGGLIDPVVFAPPRSRRRRRHFRQALDPPAIRLNASGVGSAPRLSTTYGRSIRLNASGVGSAPRVSTTYGRAIRLNASSVGSAPRVSTTYGRAIRLNASGVGSAPRLSTTYGRAIRLNASGVGSAPRLSTTYGRAIRLNASGVGSAPRVSTTYGRAMRLNASSVGSALGVSTTYGCAVSIPERWSDSTCTPEAFGRIAGGRAPDGTRESPRKTRRREHHRYRRT